jgi:hypothetical protein
MHKAATAPSFKCGIRVSYMVRRDHCEVALPRAKIPPRALVTQSPEARGHVPKYLLPISSQMAGLKQIRTIRGLRIVTRLSVLSNEPCAYLHMAARAADPSSHHLSLWYYLRGVYESVRIRFVARTYQVLDRSYG